MYQLSQVQPGEGEVLGPDHDRDQEVPQNTAGIDGIRKKKTMITPCIVKSLVVESPSWTMWSPGTRRRPARAAWPTAKAPPMKNIAVIEIEVQDRDALVIVG